MDTPLKPTIVNVSLFIALCLSIAIGVGTFGYQWMSVQQLKMQRIQDNKRLTLQLIDKCFGQWTAWTIPSVQVTCNEDRNQSRDRVKMIKAAR